MQNWKGVKVHIKITNSDMDIVYDKNELLDTDTMEDLFLKYNPKKHCISITPYMKGEDDVETE